MEMAKKAAAVYKVGNTALINTEIFEAYLEQFKNIIIIHGEVISINLD